MPDIERFCNYQARQGCECDHAKRSMVHGDQLIFAPYDLRRHNESVDHLVGIYDRVLDSVISLEEGSGDRSHAGILTGVHTYQLTPIGPFDKRDHKKMFEVVTTESVLYEFEPAATYIGRINRGRLSKGDRFEILRRDDYQCQLCGRTAHEDGVKLHVDHKVPKAKGGTNDPDNLWVLCKDCNLGKGTKSL